MIAEENDGPKVKIDEILEKEKKPANMLDSLNTFRGVTAAVTHRSHHGDKTDRGSLYTSNRVSQQTLSPKYTKYVTVRVDSKIFSKSDLSSPEVAIVPKGRRLAVIQYKEPRNRQQMRNSLSSASHRRS